MGLGIRAKLLFFAAAVLIVPSGIIGTESYTNAKQEAQQNMVSTASQSVHMLSDFISNDMDKGIEDVNFFTAIKKADIQKNPQYLLDVTRAFEAARPDAQPYVGTQTGGMFPPDGLPKNYDPRTRPWYQQAEQSTGKVVYTQPYVDMMTGNIVVTIAKTTNDGFGVVGEDINVKSIADIAKSVKIGTTGQAYILDETGDFIVNPNGKPGTKAPSDLLAQIGKSSSGTFVLGNKQYVFFKNPQTGWTVGGEVNTAEITASANKLFVKSLITILISLLFGGLLFYLIYRSITKKISQLASGVERVTNGDFTVTVPVDTKDELGQLAKNFNHMTESLHRVLMDVSDKSNQLAASAEQLHANADENTTAIERVAVTMGEMTSSSEKQVAANGDCTVLTGDISSAVGDVTEKVNTVSQLSEGAAKRATDGKAVVEKTMQQMDTIEQKVNQIGVGVQSLQGKTSEIQTILTLITDISSQTNLLALNASIEAARAGDAGKGFAVVAEEVRKLAERSAEAAVQIHDLVEEIQSETDRVGTAVDEGVSSVKDGIQMAEQAGTSFERIHASTVQVSDSILQVAASMDRIRAQASRMVTVMEETNAMALESAAGVENVAAISEEQTASMQEINASASMLAQIAEELQEVVSQFKL